MDFQQGNTFHSVFLEPRSLVTLTGEVRYHWTHGIVGRKSDLYMGKKKLRGQRISITFRTLAATDAERRKKKRDRREKRNPMMESQMLEPADDDWEKV
jgi:hypothetical protein